ATLEQRPPGIGARRALRSPVPVRKVAVARAMDRLHRRDDSECAESSEVLLAHELDVLETLAQRGRGDPRRRDGVERDTHGAIADRVYRYGEATRSGAGDVASKLDRIEGEDAAIVGAFVRVLQSGRLRAKRSV